MSFIKNILFFFILATSPAFAASTDDCSKLADLMSKDSTQFVGYASADSQSLADQDAHTELARSIRQQVTDTSTVKQTAQDVSLDSSTKSVVSEILIGAKVEKRCNSGNTYATVVTLKKDIFLSSLSEKLSSLLRKAKKLKDNLNNGASDDILSQYVDSTKTFLANYQTSAENDYELCTTYGGCSNIKIGNSFQDLSDIIAKYGDKDQYLLVTKSDSNDVSSQLKEPLIQILAAEQVKVTDSSIVSDAETTSNPRKVIASCKATVGTKIPDTNDSVVELRCSLEGYIEKQQKFRYVYSCKSIGNSTDDAISSCSGRLQKEN